MPGHKRDLYKCKYQFISRGYAIYICEMFAFLVLKNVKKMYSKNGREKVSELISYTLPQLYTGKEWYVAFMAFDPNMGKLRRKKIKLNFIKCEKARKHKAKELIMKLTLMLVKDGWNPWIEASLSQTELKFEDALNHFDRLQTKLHKDGCLELDSFKKHKSDLSVLRRYNETRKRKKVVYAYQFNKEFITDYLDYMYLEKSVSTRTRDNHLAFCRKLSKYFCEKGFLSVRPDESIKSFGKKTYKKKRTVIAANDMDRVIEYLETENKYFLLATYILYYCCVRPKEMALLNLKDISLIKQTLFISAEISKNDKDGYVTIPEKVLNLMVDLEIFNHPDNYYLFSKDFKPGKEKVDPRIFREFWVENVRKKLNLPDNYMFYSLKDTGITNMLRANIDPLTVRDQARHYSIEMTNTYAAGIGNKAQESLKRYE